ncbi:AmmeMemoRadiSam system protein B [Geodermatophilus sp. YIM 151500]|uniref:AmmeMemoRadiSam system protein B n=1 Tax=Geodermatophilus sp. YIM 151500 TaxID=2984531 RepID=UPI0021E50B44|nr:AmmeMemoRadiSam system protein B [Geodermatophilus sp. YIM 151500]MCV2489430.1 AmmeMemoRadiSam system protein B [Geodermatophilus sp. YIM 151500]
MSVHPAAVAGTFYPADPAELAALVDDLLAAARPAARPPRPVAVVSPHAGYRWSGAVAAAAHAVLGAWRDGIRRVVLLGPAHVVPLRGMAVPGADAAATPLGPVQVDDDLRTAATAAAAVAVDDRPHTGEHSLETQLPFLQRALGPGVRVLPVLVGDTPPVTVAALLGTLLALPGTVAVVSTDLSHFLGRRAARRRDERTAAAVLARDADAIGSGDACGSHPLRGLLRYAADRHLAVEQLRLATAADADGDPRRVVGYGAFLFSAAGPA